MKTKCFGVVKELAPCSEAAALEQSSRDAGVRWCLQLSKHEGNSNINTFSARGWPLVKIEPPTIILLLSSLSLPQDVSRTLL